MISLYLFPLSVAILMPLCCVLPYAFAVYYDQVNWWLPYISDTGGVLPEASLFSQMLDIAAIMIAFSIFIEYKRIKIQIQKQISDTKQINEFNRKNRICLIFAFISGFGIIIVGNYRMTELVYVHFFGAGIAFRIGGHLATMMAFLSLKLSTTDFERKLAKIRVFFAILLNVSFVIFLTLMIASIIKVGWTKFVDNEFRLHWPPSDPYYVCHYMSALFEWIGVMCFSPYFATFVLEFKRIDWKSLKETKDNENELKTFESNVNQIV